jgi:hypothetical protein
LDMFHENVYLGANEMIQNDDEQGVILFARETISKKYNEILPALAIFDKYWDSLDTQNRETIWKYLKVLCILCEKAKA